MLVHIKDIVESLSNSYGDEYFSKITLALSKIINADYTFIGRLNMETYSCKTEVLIAKGKVVDNFEYSLKNTPCADVAESSVCYYPKEVSHYFPDDQLLIDMDIQAYLGVPLIDSKQNVIGLVVALFENEHKNEEEISALFQVFSGRIAAELERLSYEQDLEEKILARTVELSNTINQLQLTQRQLVESEKMAALGNLVAGVSHEVNTPLGIAITTHSIVAEEFTKLNNKLETKTLSLKDMEKFRNISESALNMQGENLMRAKHLIENFKKTAADQHQLEVETLDIGKYYQQVISTLRSILKPQKVNLEITCESKVILATYPGIHAQILTNLINNSVKHGFSSPIDNPESTDKTRKENTININIKQTSEDEVTVNYTDNGRGLTTQAKQHIFEPFFTTARKSGGIGLGMSIVFNLISQNLNGSMELQEVDTGVCFRYKFKAIKKTIPLNE